jgi:hypothetical protein
MTQALVREVKAPSKAEVSKKSLVKN